MRTLTSSLPPAALDRSKGGVSRRLFAFGALPVVILLCFSVWMWTALHGMERTVEVDLHELTKLSLRVKDMQRDVVQVQQFLTDVSATQALDGLDDGFSLAEQHKTAFLDSLAVFTRAEADGQIQLRPEQLTLLKNNFDVYFEAGVAMAKAYVAGGPSQGNPLMAPFDAASTALQSQVGPFASQIEGELTQAEANFGDHIHRLKVLSVLVCAFAIVVVAAAGWALTRSISSPLAEALVAVRRIAGGDLVSDVGSDRQDEIGSLIREVAALRARFLDIVRHLRSATDSINTASAEIASGNQDLSTRTEQAASNLEETAASMEQLTSTVRNSADAARQANQLASSASEIAVRGGNVVGQVVTTMDEINASSKKISDIIGVIDGIAFQTNILALNAAVEAARAGEQGRGFAVVAGEVRNLAQRSAEAAKEIKGLIGSSVDRVEAGSRLVAEAGQTMSEIVASVQRVNEIIGEITAAAGEQSDGIGQVNVAVNQLDQMTQQNAALVEESAAAAESLKDQATRLAQLVQVFRIGSASVQPVAAARSLPAPALSSVAIRSPYAAAKSLNQVATVALKRPVLMATAAPRHTTAASPKPVATSGSEGDWESF